MSDLQGRLKYIEERADVISRNFRLRNHPGSKDVEELADLVGYLAQILSKHLENKEK